jgi:hypothetical protein
LNGRAIALAGLFVPKIGIDADTDQDGDYLGFEADPGSNIRPTATASMHRAATS